MNIGFRIATIVLFSLIISACQPGNNLRDTAPIGVTILGLDGATWDIIDPLIERGELPGFAQMKQEGCWGPLKTFKPTQSVSIWTSIATGVSPTRHKVQSFTVRIPGTDQTIPIPGTDRSVPAIWDIASNHSRTAGVVKWFATWPAEKVNGFMLSPRLEEDAGGHQTYPPELFNEISKFRYQSTMDDLPQPPKRIKYINPNSKSSNSDPKLLIGQNQVDRKMFDDTTVWLAGKYVYEKYKPDLFMIYLKSIDRVEHYLWGAQQVLNMPNPDPTMKAEAEAIFGLYRYFDTIIQEILLDRNRILCVVSDHGMHSNQIDSGKLNIRDLDLDKLLQFIGYQVQSASGLTNWEQTRAYEAARFTYDWKYSININERNREPNGIIPNAEKENLLESLRSTLISLQTNTQKQIFNHVEPGNEFDLLCSLNPNLDPADQINYGNQKIHIRDLLDLKSPAPRGIHTNAPPGILAITGPGIRQGKIENAEVFDITPTILRVLQLPIARDFDGKTLNSIFTDEFTREQPEKLIDSYGERRVESIYESTGADNRLKNELRALGYIS